MRHGVFEEKVTRKSLARFSIAAAQGNERARRNKLRVEQQIPRGRISQEEKRARKYWSECVLPFR